MNATKTNLLVCVVQPNIDLQGITNNMSWLFSSTSTIESDDMAKRQCPPMTPLPSSNTTCQQMAPL